MSGLPKASGLRWLFGSGGLLAWLQRNTLVVLILLLVVFVGAVDFAKPGTVNSVWLSNTLLFAAPLGILAAGQTMVMLTGGIDLSVVSVATGSAFLMTTLTLRIGDGWSVVVGLALGIVVGLINGVGVAVLSTVAGFLFLPYSPIWGIVLVAVSVIAIWGLLQGSDSSARA